MKDPPSPAPSIPILFAGTTFVIGGAERVLYHLLRGLDRPPFRVELLALREPGPIGEEIRALGVPVHANLTGPGRIDPLLPFRIARLLRRRHYRAVYFLDHAHAVFYTTVASWGSEVRVRVMPVHTTGQWDGQPSLKRPIRLVRPWLDRIIAIAEAQRDYLAETEGIPRDRMTVIHNGIPLESPPPEEQVRRRREVREALGVSGEAPVVAITAVLRPEKNHEMLLRALAALRRSVPDAELWVIGDGPRRGYLETEASALGLTGAVRFLGHRADARRLIAGADVAVLASHPRVETLPLSLIEAMDAGLPVVATRVGALAELVEPERSGYLVPPGDPEAMAGALDRLVGDEELRTRLGTRGQRIARERFSSERMVEETAGLLLQLLGREADPVLRPARRPG